MMSKSALTNPSPRGWAVSTGALWIGLLGGLFVWTAQELIVTPIVAHACFPRTLPLPQPIFSGMWVTALIIHLACVIAGVVVLVIAVRNWRAVAPRHPEGDHVGIASGRARYMAYAGILASAVFLYAIVLNFLTLFTLPACAY
jgi:hypothetical protein